MPPKTRIALVSFVCMVALFLAVSVSITNSSPAISARNIERLTLLATLKINEQLPPPFESHSDGDIRSISLYPQDNCLLAIGSFYDTPVLQVWDICAEKRLYALDVKGMGVQAVAFHPIKKAVAISLDDLAVGRIEIRDVETEGVLVTIENTDFIQQMTFFPDGKFLTGLWGDGDDFLIWDANNGKWLYRLPKSIALGLAVSNDGKRVAFGASTAWQDVPYVRGVKIFDVDTKNISDFMPNTDRVVSLDFSPDRSLLAIGEGTNVSSREKMDVLIWDFKANKITTTLEGHNGYIAGVTFSPDGRLLASASFDGTVKIWDVKTGKLLRTLDGTPAVETWIWKAVFTADGKKLIFADHGTVYIWGIK